MYKNSFQFTYNKSKGGLDMGSECKEQIRSNNKSIFRRKYMFRMLNAIALDRWRLEQCRDILLTYVKLHKEKNIPITISSCCKLIAAKRTLADYTYYMAIELLKYLSTNTLRNSVINNQHLDI